MSRERALARVEAAALELAAAARELRLAFGPDPKAPGPEKPLITEIDRARARKILRERFGR
jgi:hypothetical protein